MELARLHSCTRLRSASSRATAWKRCHAATPSRTGSTSPWGT